MGQGQDAKGTEPTRGAKRTRRDQPEGSGQLEQEVNMSFVPKLHQVHQELAMPHGICVIGRTNGVTILISGLASLTSFSTRRISQKTLCPAQWQCPEATDKDGRQLHTITPQHLHRLLSFSFFSPTHFWIFFLHNNSKPPFSLRVTAFLVSPSVTSTSKKRSSSSRTNLPYKVSEFFMFLVLYSC